MELTPEIPDLRGYVNSHTAAGILGVSTSRFWALSREDESFPEPYYLHARTALWPAKDIERIAKRRSITRRGPVATSKRTAN